MWCIFKFFNPFIYGCEPTRYIAINDLKHLVDGNLQYDHEDYLNKNAYKGHRHMKGLFLK